MGQQYSSKTVVLIKKVFGNPRGTGLGWGCDKIWAGRNGIINPGNVERI